MKCSYGSNHVPELAGLIEQGHLDDHFVRDVCTEYLEPLLSREIEGRSFGLYSFPICTTFARGTNVRAHSIHRPCF